MFVPAEEDLSWENVFLQDGVALSERVELAAGLRLERNDYTKWEVLPSMRLGWDPSPGQLLWGGASRAVPEPRVELSVLGQNLFDRRHPEYGDAQIRSEIGRSIYAELTCRCDPFD